MTRTDPRDAGEPTEAVRTTPVYRVETLGDPSLRTTTWPPGRRRSLPFIELYKLYMAISNSGEPAGFSLARPDDGT